MNDAGGVVRPDEQRQARPRHARRPHAVNGHHKVQSGQDGGESGDKDGKPGFNHLGIAEGGAERRVESPTCIHAAGQDAVQHQIVPAIDVQIPTQQVDARKRQILGADHQGNQEVSQHGRNRRNQEEEHHHLAVHGEKLVVGIGLHQVARRRQQFEPDQQSKKPSDKKEKRDRDAR